MSMRINFSPSEEAQIRRNAERVGLPMATYVKRQALNGIVHGYDVQYILDHTQKLGEAVQGIREIASAPHTDRWLYEADLERIEDKLDKLLKSESALVSLMRRKMRR